MSDIPLLFFARKLSTDKPKSIGWFKHFLGVINKLGNFKNIINVSLPILRL